MFNTQGLVFFSGPTEIPLFHQAINPKDDCMSATPPHRDKPARARSNRRSLEAPSAPAGPETFPIVGIGASAGGLDACRKLVAALPDGSGIAFILVQHLDPTHESMMVELLAGHTPMTV